jgi:glutamine synthetase
MLAAGLKGIEGGYEPPAPIEEDIYCMSADERARNGIECLPDSLYTAIQETEQSELVKDTLGKSVFRKFLDNKKVEWRPAAHRSGCELQKVPVL